MCLSFNIILWLPYKTFPLSWWIILSHWAYFNWTWGAFIHYSREGFFLSMFLGELFGISRKFLHRKFFSTIWMLKYYFLFKFICFQIWKVFFPVDNLKVELNYTCQYLLTHHFAIKCLNSLKLFQEFSDILPIYRLHGRILSKRLYRQYLQNAFRNLLLLVNCGLNTINSLF